MFIRTKKYEKKFFKLPFNFVKNLLLILPNYSLPLSKAMEYTGVELL